MRRSPSVLRLARRGQDTSTTGSICTRDLTSWIRCWHATDVGPLDSAAECASQIDRTHGGHDDEKRKGFRHVALIGDYRDGKRKQETACKDEGQRDSRQDGLGPPAVPELNDQPHERERIQQQIEPTKQRPELRKMKQLRVHRKLVFRNRRPQTK